MIVATAGHVDHGKTELIKALTGIDTDRLPEEKARGLSIDLGFAYQSLPGNKVLGFVDVPGHEKFIRNMLAGIVGIDLSLLVVAADDGVMPQTREHFAILDLLGIEQCLVAITKIDRAEDHRVVEVQNQVERLLAEAGHHRVTVFPVCAPDNQGVDALKSALQERAQAAESHQSDGYFRMAIDRVFSLKGVGLVVTGMVFSGSANIDDRLLLSADGTEIRVRGIRALNQISDIACAGDRCAINISGRGVSETSVKRGDWLLHSSLLVPTARVDVDLRVLESGNRSLKHWTATHLHVGADRIPARVAVLEGGSIAAGESGLAQLVLERDAYLLKNDRFVLRDQSAQRTLAGGHVIDPFSPKRGRSRPGRIQMLQALNQHESADALEAAAKLSETGVPAQSFAIAHNLSRTGLDMLVKQRSLHHTGDRIFSTDQWHRLLERIEAAVGAFHETSPTLPGASLRQVQLALKPYIETESLKAAMAVLLADKQLGMRGGHWHLTSHELPVSDLDQQIWAQVTPYLAPDTGSPMSLHQLADAVGLEPKILEKSLKQAVVLGEMVQISKNRYLPIAYTEKLGGAAKTLATQSDDGFTAAEYCQHIDTGRNFAIELLEYFDQNGITRREGNKRYLCKS